MLRADTRLFKKYEKAFELGFQTALEYRANFLLSLISAAYPIFIQTFLWVAIFRSTSQEQVFGYTFNQMLVYTFLAGLIGRIVRTGFEYQIMDDVKSGKFSKFLVQPLGYFPYRLCSFLGEKIPGLLMVLTILTLLLAGLALSGMVVIEFSRILVFLVTLVLAVMLNFLIFYCFSAISFWIVEIGFLFEGIRIVTVLLSGGIFPLEVFGKTFILISNLLPFKYTVNYPVNILNGKLSLIDAGWGILLQLVWILICWGLAGLLWRQGGKRYVAVGG